MRKIERILCDYVRRSLSDEKPRRPQIGTELLLTFNQLSNARTWHANGPNPITMPEIAAWCRLMQIPLRPEHVRVIIALDIVWTEHFYKRRDVPEGVKTLPPISQQPLTAALFDVAIS